MLNSYLGHTPQKWDTVPGATPCVTVPAQAVGQCKAESSDLITSSPTFQAAPGTLRGATAGLGTAKGGPALHPGQLACTCCANTGIGTIHQ